MAFGSVNPLDVPPYQLQQLVPLVFEDEFPDSGLGFGRASPRAGVSKAEVTCAQALGSEIYVGCSDGSLLRYALQANGPNLSESYTLLSRQTLPSGKAIDEIALVPSILRALILSDRQIHFYIIPSLDPVPPQIIRPIRNVISFAIDEQHMRLPPPSPSDPYHQPEPIEFCVIKRTVIALYNLKERLVQQREVPNAQGIRYARRTGRFLCAADIENYNIIDLVAASSVPLLPISQMPVENAPPVRPLVAVISDEEFLLLSSMGQSAMGVFISVNGDPVRGTLEWPYYPVSLCLDYPYVAALLPNQTIEIHSLETQAIVQVVAPTIASSPPTSTPPFSSPEPRLLLSSPAGFLVPSTQRSDKLKLVPVPLVSIPTEREPSDSDFISPPPVANSPPARPPLFPRSTTLVLTSNSIQSLLPSTLISQAEALLDSHRLDDAVDLADQSQRRVLGSSSPDEDLAEELRFVYQRVGFQYLSETLFEDAGRHLLAGETDPRMLVRYFPELRGELLKTAPTIELFAGVAEHLPREESIDEIVRNYSPHLKPDTQTAPSTAELRRVLCATARDMLAAYLRKYRTRRLLGRSGSGPQSVAVNAVVDTVLVKILAESEKTSELYTLIDEPNDIDLSEVEDPLEKNGQYNALCKLYLKSGNEEKLLEVWSKLADGLWTDEDIKDPLTQMTELLNKTPNRALVQRWGLWLTKKDADLGLKLIISRDSKRTSKADEIALLGKIREANSSAGVKYLEYLILQKRSQDPDLHDQLANVCVDQLLQCISDEATSKLWRAKASSYTSIHNESSFLLYFASTTPESDTRTIRLKTALLLQGSNLYGVEGILERMQEHQKIFKLEMAILYGKLGRHDEAISTLVHEMHDPASAEAYCTLGGDAVSGKVAWAVGDRCGLQRWAALVTGLAPGLGMGSTAGTAASNATNASIRTRAADEGTRRELLKVLLRVYMSGGASMADRTSRLLSSQAMNLDVIDVVELVPPDWPVSAMSSFLSRSFRRTLHAHHEGQIIKAISAGQNLEVVENAWLVLREQGAAIEEPVDDESDVDGAEKILDEKLGLHGPPSEPGSVAEIRIDERIAQTRESDGEGSADSDVG